MTLASEYRGPEWHRRVEQIIAHLEKTSDASWAVDVVRTRDGCNCVMGHVFDMGGGDEKLANEWWDFFEGGIASTYRIFPVNDGHNPDYQQATPKQRCLAYINNVLVGVEQTTYESMDQQIEEWHRRGQERLED
jgi:hypothetical protein